MRNKVLFHKVQPEDEGEGAVIPTGLNVKVNKSCSRVLHMKIKYWRPGF